LTKFYELTIWLIRSMRRDAAKMHVPKDWHRAASRRTAMCNFY